MNGSSRHRTTLTRATTLLAYLLVVALLAGCAQQVIAPTPSAVAVIPPAATATTAAALPTATAAAVATPTTAIQPTSTATAEPAPTPTVVPPGDFVNPVLRNDFPDPGVLHVNGTFYAYATNANGRNVPMAKSTDLVNWELEGDAMPALPTWAQLGGSFVWAPEVIQIGQHYVLYYVARDKQFDKQCIGVAIADSPEGKFKDNNDHPLVCPADEGGAIDPSPLRDGDKLYLYWKNDGNCCGIPTNIYVQELSADGQKLTSPPVRLIGNDQAWEGRVVEAPSMFKHGSTYYLFFSANDYASLNYAVGYATCTSATGPCEQAKDNPILESVLKNPPVIGPGGQTIVQVCDQTWMVYHAWEVSSTGLKTDRRFMWIDPLLWKDGKPDVEGPTTSPVPEPNTSCQKPAGG